MHVRSVRLFCSALVILYSFLLLLWLLLYSLSLCLCLWLCPAQLSSNTNNKFKHTHSCNFLRFDLLLLTIYSLPLSRFFLALYVRRSDRHLAKFYSSAPFIQFCTTGKRKNYDTPKRMQMWINDRTTCVMYSKQFIFHPCNNAQWLTDRLAIVVWLTYSWLKKSTFTQTPTSNKQ